MKKHILTLLLITSSLFSQNTKKGINSFFENSELKEFSIKSILVQGEVENAGFVDVSSLSIHSVPVKEVVTDVEGKKIFRGAYFYSGYSLYDILNMKAIRKTHEQEFKPAVDLYVIVENDEGKKVVLSWGEIYYSKDNCKIIIAQSVRAINPSKTKMQWPLAEKSKLICGNDLYPYRFLSNPTKITVTSAPGIYSQERMRETFSPHMSVLMGEEGVSISDISHTEKRSFDFIGYGHGMGYKGIQHVEGYVLRNVLSTAIKISEFMIPSAIVVVSAKDGYRAAFSLSEIMNRNDMNDFLLIEKNGSLEDGKFNIFATPDYFVDRNVRSVEKIEIIPH